MTTREMAIRQMPGWAVRARMRAKRIRQTEIAKAVPCSDAVVSSTISRSKNHPVSPELRARVWDEIEKRLAS